MPTNPGLRRVLSSSLSICRTLNLWGKSVTVPRCFQSVVISLPAFLCRPVRIAPGLAVRAQSESAPKNLPTSKIFLPPDRRSAEGRKIFDPRIGAGHGWGSSPGRKLSKASERSVKPAKGSNRQLRLSVLFLTLIPLPPFPCHSREAGSTDREGNAGRTPWIGDPCDPWLKTPATATRARDLSDLVFLS
jgi:hypothetical protein